MTTRDYEALVIVKAAGTEQEMARVAAGLEEPIKKVGGRLETNQNMGRRRLASTQRVTWLASISEPVPRSVPSPVRRGIYSFHASLRKNARFRSFQRLQVPRCRNARVRLIWIACSIACRSGNDS